jgi:hypothetical protein
MIKQAPYAMHIQQCSVNATIRELFDYFQIDKESSPITAENEYICWCDTVAPDVRKAAKNCTKWQTVVNSTL